MTIILWINHTSGRVEGEHSGCSRIWWWCWLHTSKFQGFFICLSTRSHHIPSSSPNCSWWNILNSHRNRLAPLRGSGFELHRLESLNCRKHYGIKPKWPQRQASSGELWSVSSNPLGKWFHMWKNLWSSTDSSERWTSHSRLLRIDSCKGSSTRGGVHSRPYIWRPQSMFHPCTRRSPWNSNSRFPGLIAWCKIHLGCTRLWWWLLHLTSRWHSRTRTFLGGGDSHFCRCGSHLGCLQRTTLLIRISSRVLRVLLFDLRS